MVKIEDLKKINLLHGLPDDLLEINSELKLLKPVLCGLSMGGYIAQQFAADHDVSFSTLNTQDTQLVTPIAR